MQPAVLVVEPYRDQRESLVDVLALQGYRAMGCRTGAEGVTFAADADFDAVVIALALSDCLGESLATRVKQIMPSPVVIAYSGSQRRRRAALTAGCDAFVLKPRMDDLLRELFDRVRQPRSQSSFAETYAR